MLPLASLTGLIGNYGLTAVFLLMIVAAVLPAASELTMLYGGAVASGAFSDSHIVLFGHQFSSGTHAYVVVALVGALGNVIGTIGGWAIGFYGGRPLLERHGRLLHVTPERLGRAERWFARFGRIAVPVGFLTPVIRSFVAIPAGLAELRLPRFVALACVGCIPFCFGLAGAGWAFGANYNSFLHGFRFADYLVVAAVVAAVFYAILRRRRSSTLNRRASDSSR